MPKVVSRSAVSSSADAKPTASSTTALRVYYCLCGEFILVADKNIGKLPQRQTDGAHILRAQDAPGRKAAVFKLNCTLTDPVMVERANGLEQQFRFLCPRCNLVVGYQSTPGPVKSGAFVYIHRGAVTQIQGQVPANVFEGEETLPSRDEK